ncbi:hypothetical protein NX773_15400 [Massilia solisilvae]|uniref:Uncharacterized protein n=1 Tax=Massilia solisilvae TaxID=1811225 RepID=A0ABT2BMD7_9BURK|nr:hypothetical protein [Massilia solisilvae]MCS0609556.1 hypothetical protein [Massilia solisilvae]
MNVAALVNGAAHAMVFAIFALAWLGKLLGCTGAVRSLCARAAVDFALAGLGLLPWAPAEVVCGVLALGIGTGGWAAERLRRNPVCRCFGLLNRGLHGQRNRFRAGLVLGGVLLAATAGHGGGAAAWWAGAACVLAALLLLVAAAFGTARGDKPLPKGAPVVVPEPLVQCTLDAALQLGQTQEGRMVTLGELPRDDGPLALLLTLPGCGECDTVKAEFLPFRSHFRFPLLVLERGGGGGEAGHLLDTGGHLARRLRIGGFPALVVIDPADLTLASPVAFGAAAIRKRLMHMIFDDRARQVISNR